jgi:hypothetical protein
MPRMSADDLPETRPSWASAWTNAGRRAAFEQATTPLITLEVVLLITIEHFLETGELYYILPGISVFPLRYPPGECLV